MKETIDEIKTEIKTLEGYMRESLERIASANTQTAISMERLATAMDGHKQLITQQLSNMDKDINVIGEGMRQNAVGVQQNKFDINRVSDKVQELHIEQKEIKEGSVVLKKRLETLEAYKERQSGVFGLWRWLWGAILGLAGLLTGVFLR